MTRKLTRNIDNFGRGKNRNCEGGKVVLSVALTIYSCSQLRLLDICKIIMLPTSETLYLGACLKSITTLFESKREK